ncbi:MAG TPA: CHAT domain-containing protein [Anaerolineae bacterium]|nr:CHAT domain-containing protein [Anaerolineae bacterium]
MSGNTNKLLAGALLAGMGIVTGQATLIATAGAVGANWLGEGLAGLWPALSGRSPDPLARAYAAAIRSAVDTLEQEYRRAVDPQSDRAAFRLVADCADAVAGAEFPPGVADADTAQRALEASLAALLHGHDPRQAAFLQQRLQSTCALAFRQQLVRDDAAWRAFHGLLLQALAGNITALLGKLERFNEVLAAWSNPEASRLQLQRIEAQLEALAARPAAATPVRFDNRGMRVGGSVYQAAGNQYFHSAHAESGGTATVTNVIGAPPGAVPAAAPDAGGATLLFLAANPQNTPRLRLDQEARRVGEALRQARLGARFHLEQQWAARSTDLLDILLRHRPAIVHFAGHGDVAGHLILEDATGQATPIAPAALAGLLAAAPGVRCVLLNACWSDALAGALLNVTACVVGMSAEAPDAAAIAFAAGFYRALADGASVAAAVMAGRAQVQAEQGADAALAVELRAAAGVDPSAVRFI